jgi:hypothetical protein
MLSPRRGRWTFQRRTEEKHSGRKTRIDEERGDALVAKHKIVMILGKATTEEYVLANVRK